VQDGKPKKSVERRESTRLQNAAKLLRNLSKGKDLNIAGDQTAAAAANKAGNNSPASITKSPAGSTVSAESDRRHHPAYQSEGKGKRRERRDGGRNSQGSGSSRSAVVDRAHSFCSSRDSRKEQRKATAAAAAASNVGSDSKRWLEKSRSCQRLEDRIGGDVISTTRATAASAASPQATTLLGGVRGDEAVVTGAKSILLTEDNLLPIDTATAAKSSSRSPDLIQDLPSDLTEHAQSSSPVRQQMQPPAEEKGSSWPPSSLPSPAPAVSVDSEQSSSGVSPSPNKDEVILNSNLEKASDFNERSDSIPAWLVNYSGSGSSAEPQAAQSERPRPASMLVGGLLEDLPSSRASDEADSGVSTELEPTDR
jgi:hypothetical protein